MSNLACIQLELTETAIINNFENTLSILNKLQKAQINISIDDFGTGYSSLNVLRKLPIDEVKIDKSFIRDLQNSEEDRSIVQSILAMAHSLHLRVVAEGVEYNEQARFLREQGCDELQGYLLAKPLAIGDLEYFCQQFENSPECASPQLNALRNYMVAQEGFVPK